MDVCVCALKKEITYIKYSSLTVKECDFIYK